MAAITEELQIKALENKLDALYPNFKAIEETFLSHTSSGFTEEFLQKELATIAKNPAHLVKNIVAQLNINVIKSRTFDYTIHLGIPSENNTSQVKWTGASQILAIKGRGSIHVRILQIPDSVNINYFQSDVAFDVLEERELCSGDSIVCQGPYKILDIVKINSAVVIESLTIKNTEMDVIWSFNENGQSFMTESSKVTMSRLTNMLNVIAHMGATTPPKLYETIFTYGDANLKLKAIQAMLAEGNHAAFDRIQEAIDSPNDLLAEGAQLILDRLVSYKH